MRPCGYNDRLLVGCDGRLDELFGDPCIMNPRALVLDGCGSGIGTLMTMAGLMCSGESCGLSMGWGYYVGRASVFCMA